MSTDLQHNLNELIRDAQDLIADAGRSAFAELNIAILSAPGWTSAQYEADKMKAAIAEVDRIAQREVTQFTDDRYLCFVLVRRICPILFHELATLPRFHNSDERKPVSPDAVTQCIRIASDFAVAFLPLGTRKHTSAAPQQEHPIDARTIRFLATICFLAEQKFNFEVWYRFACKNVPLPELLESFPCAPVSVQNSIVSDYERRRDAFDTLAGSAGLWYDPLTTIPVRPKLCAFWGASSTKAAEPYAIRSASPERLITVQWHPTLAADRRAVGTVDGPGASEAANPDEHAPARLVPYDAILRDFGDSFEAAFSLPAENFTVLLYALAVHLHAQLGLSVFEDESSERPRELMFPSTIGTTAEQRGIILSHLARACELGFVAASDTAWQSTITSYASEISRAYPELVTLGRRDVATLVERFTEKGYPASPSASPTLFKRLSEDFLVLDLLNGADFLRDVLVALSVVERSPEGKGLGPRTAKWHERQAAAHFQRELSLDRSKMLVSYIFPDKSSEVDLAFVFGRTLFVVDCKAMAKDREFMAGDHKKLRNRKTEFLRELSQKCVKRAELIQSGRARPTIEPADFDKRIAMVCTTAVEYIDPSDSQFAMGGLPVVGPPEELVHTIRRVCSRPAGPELESERQPK